MYYHDFDQEYKVEYILIYNYMHARQILENISF